MKPYERIEQLTKLIGSRTAEMGSIYGKAETENRNLTKEEAKKINELLGENEGFQEELFLVKRQALFDEKMNQPFGSKVAKPEFNTLDELQAKYPGLPSKENRFDNVGDYLLAVKRAADGSTDTRLRQTGMNEGTPAEGGFFVQVDHSTEMLRRVYTESSVVSRVRKISVGANANGLTMNGFAETTRVGSILGGIIMYWLGEAGTKTASKPVFRQIEMKLKKIAGLFYATDELLEDAVALAGVANDGFVEALDVQLEEAFIRGTGAGTPMGIMNSGALITVLKETGQLANTILAENVINMWARLWSRSMPNAVWFISQSILPQLMVLQMPGLVGIPLWMPPAGLAQSPYGTLLGRPIFAIENCSALGTTGDIILADMSQYLVIDKGGVQTASSIHVKFVYDETAFRIVYRVDGMPLWNSTLAPRDGSATVSPFVTLESRT